MGLLYVRAALSQKLNWLVNFRGLPPFAAGLGASTFVSGSPSPSPSSSSSCSGFSSSFLSPLSSSSSFVSSSFSSLSSSGIASGSINSSPSVMFSVLWRLLAVIKSLYILFYSRNSYCYIKIYLRSIPCSINWIRASSESLWSRVPWASYTLSKLSGGGNETNCFWA